MSKTVNLKRVYKPLEFNIELYNKADVLQELFGDDDSYDKTLTDSIITLMDKDMGDYISQRNIVSIPYIGKVVIDDTRRKTQSKIRKAGGLAKLLNQNVSKENYKRFIKDAVNDVKAENRKLANDKLIMRVIRKNNKKHYTRLLRTLGKAYAEAYILSIFLIREVPFDEEFEEQYQALLKAEKEQKK